MTVYMFKDMYGFIKWFIKEEQIDHITNFKTYKQAEREIISDLRRKKLIFSKDEIIFKKAN